MSADKLEIEIVDSPSNDATPAPRGEAGREADRLNAETQAKYPDVFARLQEILNRKANAGSSGVTAGVTSGGTTQSPPPTAPDQPTPPAPPDFQDRKADRFWDGLQKLAERAPTPPTQSPTPPAPPVASPPQFDELRNRLDNLQESLRKRREALDAELANAPSDRLVSRMKRQRSRRMSERLRSLRERHKPVVPKKEKPTTLRASDFVKPQWSAAREHKDETKQLQQKLIRSYQRKQFAKRNPAAVAHLDRLKKRLGMGARGGNAVRGAGAMARGAGMIGRAASGAIGGSVGAAGSAVAGIAAAAGPAAIAAASLTAVAVSAKLVVNHFDEMARKFERFAPQTAMARARQDITGQMGDMNRARLLDDDLARFVDIQTDASEILSDIKAVITKAGLETITPILEELLRDIQVMFKAAIDGAKRADKMLEKVDPALRLVDRLPGGVGLLNTFLRAAIRALANLDKDDDDKGFMDNFLGMDIPFGGNPGNFNPVQPGKGMAIIGVPQFPNIQPP